VAGNSAGGHQAWRAVAGGWHRQQQRRRWQDGGGSVSGYLNVMARIRRQLCYRYQKHRSSVKTMRRRREKRRRRKNQT
jgi:hypothetical protein